MSRSDRFKEAFDWLDRKGKVKTKKQLATMMGYDRSVVSNAYNGSDDYANEKFLAKFCDAFPGLFNYEWLVNGKGEMLANECKKEPMSLEERFDDLMKQQKQLLSILEADRDSYTRVIEKLANELADIKVTLRQMASGQPVQYYSVADSDVNPVNLNDPLKQIK